MKRRTYKHSKKNRISKEIIISLGIVLIILIVLGALNFTRIKLFAKGYGFYEQSIIMNLEPEEIERYLSNDQVIDVKTWDEINNQRHYLEYETYQTYKKDLSKEEIVSYIDTYYQKYNQGLKKLNYTYSQIISLMQDADLSDFEMIIEHQYSYQTIKPYLAVRGMKLRDLPAYIESKKDPIPAVLSIAYPAIDANNRVDQTYQILDPDNLLVLIKKGFVLPKNYEPNDLIVPDIPIAPDNNNKKLRKPAAKALEKMYQAALKEDLHLVLNSGYRTYKSQQKIYDDYFKRYDEVTASGLVAQPGSSEHQLGLGADLTSQSVVDKKKMVFGDTKEYQWVKENAHKYGFIIRYPKDKTKLTGTANEPWHVRYVGKKVAKIIYEHDWTLEEYILNYGMNYDLKKVN